MNNLEKYFEEIQERYYRFLLFQFQKLVEQARDKEYAKSMETMLLAMFHCFHQLNPFNKELIDMFKHNYKLGLPLDNVLKQVHDLQRRHIIRKEFTQRENEGHVKLEFEYETFFHKLFNKPKNLKVKEIKAPKIEFGSDLITENNPKKIVKFLIQYYTFERFFNENNISELQNINLDEVTNRLFVKSKKEPQTELSEQKSENIKWNGTQLDFIQLIYALHHSNLIKSNENEISKIVTQFATIFNVKLSSNWQANLSKSIHNRNNDFEPQVFELLKSAFSEYSNSLINKKK